MLEVLRDDLGLVGAEEGCGVGMCGACTVLVDGKPVSGCLTLAAQATGREILTVEGLARDGKLHPIQRVSLRKELFNVPIARQGLFFPLWLC